MITRNVLLPVAIVILFFHCKESSDSAELWGIAIHGGAGAISKSNMTTEKDSLYRAALSEALSIGEKILQSGGTSLDAVEQTIVFLEDNPLFNAGKGAVFSHEGKNELDASIMEGQNLKAGAVGSVTIVKNPIRLARVVMEQSQHVFLVSKGAEQFALNKGLDTVSPSWFYTDERWQSYLKAIEKDSSSGYRHQINMLNSDMKYGTVGCVALDRMGNLCAGTSTGGMTNKRWNRIGDSPVIGAGTYADNSCCAVSCTGHGEYFIRYAVAHDLCAMMKYGNNTLEQAGNQIIHHKLVEAGGEGGLIAIDKLGNIILPFNTQGMYRAYSKPGIRKISIYNE